MQCIIFCLYHQPQAHRLVERYSLAAPTSPQGESVTAHPLDQDPPLDSELEGELEDDIAIDIEIVGLSQSGSGMCCSQHTSWA